MQQQCVSLPAVTSMHNCLLVHADDFHARMQLLQSAISQRAESVIAIVSHFSVLKHMTGRELDNGEVWSCHWQDGVCITDHA